MESADQIIDAIDQILVDQFELDPSAVVPGASLRDDLDLDSLDAADLMIAIEARWPIRLDDQVARTCLTVGDIHAYVRGLVLTSAA
jgi:acyl carrier protein